ncbi:unnamed protein product (macronuclear) [Paramecium tetraurelia]|uniref:Chromosome undetermined scaffold_38, whole genome shotgun sequence n=2 Tax=Paramecium TaxID=5884 RepID=A0D519_PARTE|nr:uncharacterized protein GSPATT00013583001 [Paramecium tetraurelia]XP_001449883.1 uncharacterized protein GSPATT00016873001 [Paramecium tetraurelia]CAD8163387.1 unnamed protein product [Paramecium octaurelia]CAD8164061.1 unnamed protein product [Paramecium octaurelia]CAK78136.1 unnamed protein product [Paramecium tetraurelia]CAK82486.1 unnamed protein product [Paramecium tetraurelia]|eukprot:XP_001445533.1 hypothetical protein (macronuclear) [Paramecium tetraurelia strain d4-2]
MGVRVTYRRRTSYNTRSNKIRKVKTPGGNVVAQYPNKKTSASTCADSNLSVVLNGLKRIRPTKLKQLARRQRTVSRPYGGVLSAGALKNRIIRAFLVEEVKIVKQIKK